jgi:hypothetical protein
MAASGLNFAYAESTEQARDWFKEYVRTGKPGAVVFYDTYGQYKLDALKLAYDNPQTVVIYRYYIQGDWQFNYLSAVAWANHHDEFRGGPDNLFCSADNEAPTGAAAAWYLRVLEEANRRDINVSVGGFGTGQPSDAELPLLDDVLRFMAAHPKRAVIDCHCYFRALAWCDFARDAKHPSQWPTKAPTDNGALHLLGRFRRILARADAIKVKRPRIVIGEHGPDRVHAVPADVYGDTGGLLHCLHTWAGWGVGDAEDYGAAMMRAAWNVFYKPCPEVIGACFFTVTDHPTHWGEHNAWYAPRFLDGIKQGFDRMPILPSQPTPVYTPYKLGHYLLDSDNVRIRAAADTSAQIVKTLYTGAQVRVMSTTVIINDGYGWQEVECGEWRGFMALHGSGVTWSLSPVPVTPQPDPVTRAQLLAWADTLQTVVDDMRAKAETL